MKIGSQAERLIVLAADRDMEEAIRAVLRRPDSLRMRAVCFECRRHPNRDAGCRAQAAEFLRPFRKRFSHALVVFDREGCGRSEPRDVIERDVEDALNRSGWQTRGKAIVIDPELEEWLWSESPAVLKGIRWKRGFAELRSWLEKEAVWDHSLAKPQNPKAALERTLRRTRRRRSARLYGEIAAAVSLARCQDAAFRKLKAVLQDWFPMPSATDA